MTQLAITLRQIRQKEEEYRKWADYFTRLRAELLSKAFPKAIILKDNHIEYQYSQDVENILKKIDRIEKERIKY